MKSLLDRMACHVVEGSISRVMQSPAGLVSPSQELKQQKLEKLQCRQWQHVTRAREGFL